MEQSLLVLNEVVGLLLLAEGVGVETQLGTGAEGEGGLDCGFAGGGEGFGVGVVLVGGAVN